MQLQVQQPGSNVMLPHEGCQCFVSVAITADIQACQCRAEMLPLETKHLVVVMTVPLVWPKLPFSEGVLSAVDKASLLKKTMSKTGVGAGVVDKYVPLWNAWVA